MHGQFEWLKPEFTGQSYQLFMPETVDMLQRREDVDGVFIAFHIGPVNFPKYILDIVRIWHTEVQ